MTTTRKLIRIWDFDGDIVSSLTYSDKALITVDRRLAVLTLKTQYASGTGRQSFPTEADIFVILPLFEVGALQSLEIVQVVGATPKNPLLASASQQVTSTPMRLHDGSAHYWWDGADWALAGAGDWNTVKEVTDHIGTWDLDAPFALVLSLLTSDGAYAPTVKQVKLLYSVELPSFIHDWVYSTLIDQLADAIRPTSDLITEAEGGLTLALGGLDLGVAYNISSIDGVWNQDTDAKHRANLYSAYDAGSNTITLTSSPTVGTRLFVRFRYAPIVAVQTGQDFSELDSTPSLLFESIVEDDLGAAGSGDHILDVHATPPVGVILPAPRRCNLNFSLLACAPSGVDLDRLMEAVTSFIDSHRTITSAATGITRSLRVQEPFSRRSEPNLSDLNTASMSFTIENVYIWHNDAVDAVGVGAFRVGFNVGASSDTVTIED